MVEIHMDKYFHEMSPEQRRHLEDARQLWEVWAPLAKRRDALVGAVAWKTVSDREYLVHYWHDEDLGDKRMTSLGPRSPQTEKQKEDWERDRKEVDGALAKLKPRLEGLARVGRALRVGRIERAPSDVLRQLWRADFLGSAVVVGGSAAIHLYEASAGVLAPQALLPEEDLDLVVVGRADIDEDELVRILRRADRSFRRGSRQRSFANAEGFRVDLIPLGDMCAFFTRLPGLSTDQIHVLEWAVNMRPVTALAVGRDGMPVPMTGIDPRAFSVLKYARAEFDSDRHRNAAEIDRAQAFLVGALVRSEWRHEFDPEWLEAFPGLAEGINVDSRDHGGPRFFM
jgi:hypothetical protein